MKTIFRFMLASFLFTVLSFADTAVVKRNVTLRPGPSTENQAVVTLLRRQRVTVLSPRKTNGYLHVSVNGQKGWVWARNVDVEETSGEEPEGDSRTAKDTEEGAETCASGGGNAGGRIGPPELYPQPMKTPGCAATLEVDDLTRLWTVNCPGGKASCTYSQAHRKVSQAERTFVYDQYKVPASKRKIEHGEVDHFHPLCAGGSNSANNLWYQPIRNEWNGRSFGYKEKDKLEAWVCQQIKKRKLDPREAFSRMTKDWVRFYLEEIVGDDELEEQVSDDEGEGRE